MDLASPIKLGHRCTVALLAAGLLWLCSPLCLARAQADAAAPTGYREAVDEGLAEMELKNFEEAREQFRRAHALYPNARTLRGLGFIEFELRNYPESVRLLEEALSSRVKPLEGALRSESESVLQRARGYVGEIAIEVEPTTALVTIDGSTAQRGPNGTFVLPVGDHVLALHAPGFRSDQRRITIVGRTYATLQIALVGVTPESGSGAPSRSDQAEPRPLHRRWWLWTVVGVVVAGGALTAAILLTQEERDGQRPLATPSGVAFQALETR
jgi:hypothetical protein